MRDPVQATGWNRSSLYAAFGDKAEVLQMALRVFEERSLWTLLTAAEKAAPGEAAREAWMAAKLRPTAAVVETRNPRQLNLSAADCDADS